MARKFSCNACGKYIVVNRAEPGVDVQCRNCGKRMPVPEEAEAALMKEFNTYMMIGSSGPLAGGASGTSDHGLSAADAAGGAAWLVLIVHIIGAIVVWIVFGRQAVPGYSRTSVELNPIGVALGIGVLAEGIIFCIALRAIHWAAKNTAELRAQLGRHTT